MSLLGLKLSRCVFECARTLIFIFAMAALVALVYFVIFLIPACVVRPSTKGHIQQGRRSFGIATNPGRVGPGQMHVHTTCTHTPTLTRAHTHSKAKTSTEEYQPMSYLPPMFKVDHDCANIRSHILLTIHPYDIHTHKSFHVIHTQIRLDEKNIEKYRTKFYMDNSTNARVSCDFGPSQRQGPTQNHTNTPVPLPNTLA